MSKRRITDARLAEIFKALSNSNRLRLFLRLVAVCGPGTSCTTDEGMRACVGELGGHVEVTPSTVSHHLKELRRSGLIRTRRRGKNVECWIDFDTVRDVAKFFVHLHQR